MLYCLEECLMIRYGTIHNFIPYHYCIFKSKSKYISYNDMQKKH